MNSLLQVYNWLSKLSKAERQGTVKMHRKVKETQHTDNYFENTADSVVIETILKHIKVDTFITAYLQNKINFCWGRAWTYF